MEKARIASDVTTVDRWAVFEHSSARLRGIARRILGSSDDAEDVVQEASLRWLQADVAAVRAPEGWLVAVVTRLSIDRVRRGATERRTYDRVRSLAPDVAFSWAAPDPSPEITHRVSAAFRLLRRHLSTPERTAFVLREVFACDYGELARVLDRTEAACRQIVHRARERLRASWSRLSLCIDDAPGLAERFVTALAAGDRQGVLDAVNGDPTADRRRGPQGARATGTPRRAQPWHRRQTASPPCWEPVAAVESPAA